MKIIWDIYSLDIHQSSAELHNSRLSHLPTHPSTHN